MPIYCVLVASRFNDAKGKAKDYEVGELLSTDLPYGNSLVESGFIRPWTDEDEREAVPEEVDPETLVATKPLPKRPDAREEAAEWRESLVVPEDTEPQVEEKFDLESLELVDEVGLFDDFDVPEILPPVAAVEVSATPAARKYAEELGIPLASIKGTGSDGKITKADVYDHHNED